MMDKHLSKTEKGTGLTPRSLSIYLCITIACSAQVNSSPKILESSLDKIWTKLTSWHDQEDLLKNILHIFLSLLLLTRRQNCLLNRVLHAILKRSVGPANTGFLKMSLN